MQMDEQAFFATLQGLPVFLENLRKDRKNYDILEARNRTLLENQESMVNAMRQMQGTLTAVLFDINQKEEEQQVVKGNEKNKENGRKTRATQNLKSCEHSQTANVVSDQSPSKINKSKKRKIESARASEEIEGKEEEEKEESRGMDDSKGSDDSESLGDESTKKENNPQKLIIATPTSKKTPAPTEIEGFKRRRKRDTSGTMRTAYKCYGCRKKFCATRALGHICQLPFAAAALVPEHREPTEDSACVGTLVYEPKNQ